MNNFPNVFPDMAAFYQFAAGVPSPSVLVPYYGARSAIRHPEPLKYQGMTVRHFEVQTSDDEWQVEVASGHDQFGMLRSPHIRQSHFKS